jgi:4-diphosphocytidyl-2-C-methyl-D-erythritol kinase
VTPPRAPTTTPHAELAPAKVNLALHVTGRRPDGYHLLDSLVAFPGIGDRLAAEPAATLSLEVTGLFAPGLRGDEAENLVLRAARLVQPQGRGARIVLEKNLPVAAGLGGGSSDAAAALRLLPRLWRTEAPSAEAALGLGADVPVCLLGRPARMRGIGERLDPIDLPPFWTLLVNPGVAVPTGPIFAALERRDNPPLAGPLAFPDAGALFAWLRRARNDLEAPAARLAPTIGLTLAAISSQPGCALARMSGSGATCFGLFAAEGRARAAAASLGRAEPRWWVRAAPCGDVGPDDSR